MIQSNIPKILQITKKTLIIPPFNKNVPSKNKKAKNNKKFNTQIRMYSIINLLLSNCY
jgi:hypothetical protein